MAKKKAKAVSPPTPKEKQEIDGLNMPFEEVMKILANPPKDKTK
ncbi:hypothetical protein BDD43_3689 [Mucilaginibacter gracilis]|uniref:Uncharacterized protein n=1 Tax=Mucilaginibacter gracilis TaxID=423350 RepID=A0A495J3E1_9SPHI|nr:hypothetical protein [Mucilaginibacter gracilis]RKR83480.1 hypothetical protein BDD43_3689 [Mucilaginibacter gracilis]